MLLLFLGVIAAAAYMGFSIYQNQVQMEPLCKDPGGVGSAGMRECDDNSPYRDRVKYTAPYEITEARCKELGGEYVVGYSLTNPRFCLKR